MFYCFYIHLPQSPKLNCFAYGWEVLRSYACFHALDGAKEFVNVLSYFMQIDKIFKKYIFLISCCYIGHFVFLGAVASMKFFALLMQ